MFQLVLQFYKDAVSDLDSLVALEDELVKEFAGTVDVDIDGHDCGSGESNIFIFTLYPEHTFQKLLPVLEKKGCLQSMAAAYRSVDGNNYTVIWPKGSTKEFRVL